MVQNKIKKVIIEENEEGFWAGFLKSLKENILNNIVGNLKENIKEKVEVIQKRIYRRFNSYVFLYLGIIWLYLAFIFFMNYYLNWVGCFLITGIISLLISLFFKLWAKTI